MGCSQRLFFSSFCRLHFSCDRGRIGATSTPRSLYLGEGAMCVPTTTNVDGGNGSWVGSAVAFFRDHIQ